MPAHVIPDHVAADLAGQLEDGTLDGGTFPHADHVRVARWYVRTYGPAEALSRFSAAVRRFAESKGSTKYHETITWALLILIADREARAATDQTWESFAATNADLLEYPGVLHRWYRPETLATPHAKAHFVLPDA